MEGNDGPDGVGRELRAGPGEAARRGLPDVGVGERGRGRGAGDWLRLARSDSEAINDLSAWLTTVVGRVCLDMLRSRRARLDKTSPVPLPDLIITAEDPDPSDEAVLADSVGAALLIVLETLSPAERLAFVLHDLFAVPFDEIATVLDRSTNATKMLASRARRRIRAVDATPEPDPDRQRRVIDGFLAAARDGDFEGLLAVLDPDVVQHAETEEGISVTLGSTVVAGRAVMYAQLFADVVETLSAVRVNDEPGVLTWTADGQPQSLVVFTIVDDRIVRMLALADPDRVAQLDLPARR